MQELEEITQRSEVNKFLTLLFTTAYFLRKNQPTAPADVIFNYEQIITD